MPGVIVWQAHMNRLRAMYKTEFGNLGFMDCLWLQVGFPSDKAEQDINSLFCYR
jgi:hypothetical protein